MNASITIPIRAQYLMEPTSPEAGSRVVLGFHGYAERAEVQQQRLIALKLSQPTVCCCPEAYNRFYSRSGRVVASWMTKAYRKEAIDDCIGYIDSLMRVLSETWKCNESPVLFGFSQGAALAYRYAVRGEFKSKGLVVVGSDIPPDIFDQLSKLPKTLVCHGEQDERVAIEAFNQSVERLGAAKVEFSKYCYQGGHFPQEQCLARIADFVENEL